MKYYFGSFILEAVIFSNFIAVTYSEHAGISSMGRDLHTASKPSKKNWALRLKYVWVTVA